MAYIWEKYGVVHPQAIGVGGDGLGVSKTQLGDIKTLKAKTRSKDNHRKRWSVTQIESGELYLFHQF